MIQDAPCPAGSPSQPNPHFRIGTHAPTHPSIHPFLPLPHLFLTTDLHHPHSYSNPLRWRIAKKLSREIAATTAHASSEGRDGEGEAWLTERDMWLSSL